MGKAQAENLGWGLPNNMVFKKSGPFKKDHFFKSLKKSCAYLPEL